MTKTYLSYGVLSIALALALMACKNTQDNPNTNGYDEATLAQIRLETLSGGKLGTTFNASASAYEDPTPAVENAGLGTSFKYGEFFFERTITENSAPFKGLGPLYIRNSCESCHPGYGHGKRMNRYRADDWGNGYLLVVTNQQGQYLSSLTGMPQTKAVAPFKAPIDENQISIAWLNYTDEWGNRFADGESYELIYPEVTIPQSAYYVPLECGGQPIDYSQVKVRIESTIGVYGVGLIDAIPDDSLRAQYQKESDDGYVNLNPKFWAGNDWAPTAFYGKTNHPKRYTYALTRGPLQDAPGSNAIWNITNMTRSNRRSNYMTATYARTASQDPDVQASFYNYFPEWNKTGNVEQDIYHYLMCDTLPAEMSDEDFVNFMVWHRGLAVPAARNLEDADVQRGKKLFNEMGCAYCHRPTWTTGPDDFTDPSNFFADGDRRLPRYPYQKIWPYTDLIQHRLEMVNNINTGWCRTTPLWGRGLSLLCTGAQDRLHDCRARNVIEAIMWHGSPNSDARFAVERFRQLTKAERDAVVKFINAI